MKNKINIWYQKIRKFFLRLSNFKIILIVYTLTTLFFAILLSLPFSQQKGANVSFIDSLFTAASAFSDTGLTTTPVVSSWSVIGQAIIAILILLGGVGIFALKVYVINVLLKRSISLSSRNILEKERSGVNSGSIKKTISTSISILIFSIIISTIVLTLIFYYEKGDFVTNFDPNSNETQYDPHNNWAMSFKYAIFHSISALNNAGIDIISSKSLTPYYHVYSIQIVFIILLVIGGIGYPVIYELYRWTNHKIRKRGIFNFSLFTKISCISYLVIFVIGLLSVMLFEIAASDGIWQSKDPNFGNYSNKMMAIFFHVFSTRSAGFSTVDFKSFTEVTLVIFSILMFIGAAPSSTAGGIRTTTIAIIFLSVWSKLRGNDNIHVFNKKIPQSTIHSSFLVLTMSITLILVTSIVCYTSLNTLWGDAQAYDSATGEGFRFVHIFFETSSAFGTAGLSTGLTSHLNIVSKLFIILVMFIGQLGVSSTILVWKANPNSKKPYDYIEENVMIG